MVTAAEIANPDYVGKDWQIYLIFLLLLVVQGFIAMQSTKVIGYLNVAGTACNVILVFIFIIWFPAGSINPLNNNKEVWTTFEVNQILG